jgi:hypothetical protein
MMNVGRMMNEAPRRDRIFLTMLIVPAPSATSINEGARLNGWHTSYFSQSRVNSTLKTSSPQKLARVPYPLRFCSVP